MGHITAFFACYIAWCAIVLLVYVAVLQTFKGTFRHDRERLALKRAAEFTMVVTAIEVVELRRDIWDSRCSFARSPLSDSSLTEKG
jgi:hypothetical protein